MKVVLAGQRSFGREVYKRLVADGHEIVAVATPPPGKYYDKLHGLALRDRVPVVLPEDRLLASNIPDDAELLVGAHSHQYIGKRTRDKLRGRVIGYHPSLLPRHRGRDAVRWTIKMRDPIAGGTVYWFDDTVDGGPILAQEWCHVDPHWGTSDLWRLRLFPMGVQLLSDAVKAVAADCAPAVEQDEAFATWEPSFERPRLYRPELIRLGSENSEGVA